MKTAALIGATSRQTVRQTDSQTQLGFNFRFLVSCEDFSLLG